MRRLALLLRLLARTSACGRIREKFYERYRAARGLLALSAPAVSASGDEALVYAHLLMVFSQTGRLFYLKKRAGRWAIEWSVELVSMPGC